MILKIWTPQIDRQVPHQQQYLENTKQMKLSHDNNNLNTTFLKFDKKMYYKSEHIMHFYAYDCMLPIGDSCKLNKDFLEGYGFEVEDSCKLNKDFLPA